MSTSSRILALPVVAFATSLAFAATLMGIWADRRFIPNLSMREHVAQGDACAVFLGDSRMVASIDTGVMRTSLGRCVVNLSIGGVTFPGQTILLREYLARGPRPRAVVLGFVGDQLLAEASAADPAGWSGNRAAVLQWSHFSDVTTLYPGFPLSHIDKGIRFLLYRSNPLGTFMSVLWFKAQALQDRLTGKAAAESNQFGAVGDMVDMQRTLESTASRRLSEQPYAEHPWLMHWRQQLAAQNIKLVLAALPTTDRFRNTVTRSAGGQSYLHWQCQRDPCVDLSTAEQWRDEDFPDQVHMTPEAAARFSAQLAGRLAPLL